CLTPQPSNELSEIAAAWGCSCSDCARIAGLRARPSNGAARGTSLSGNLGAGAMGPAQREARQATSAVGRRARHYSESERPYLPLRQIIKYRDHALNYAPNSPTTSNPATRKALSSASTELPRLLQTFVEL